MDTLKAIAKDLNSQLSNYLTIFGILSLIFLSIYQIVINFWRVIFIAGIIYVISKFVLLRTSRNVTIGSIFQIVTYFQIPHLTLTLIAGSELTQLLEIFSFGAMLFLTWMAIHEKDMKEKQE